MSSFEGLTAYFIWANNKMDSFSRNIYFLQQNGRTILFLTCMINFFLYCFRKSEHLPEQTLLMASFHNFQILNQTIVFNLF
jgi:hypothetical protein